MPAMKQGTVGNKLVYGFYMFVYTFLRGKTSCIYMIEAHDSCREAMEELVDSGLVRHLGVSNFSVKQVEELLECARIKPVANQVELHPFLPQRKLVGVCARKVFISDCGKRQSVQKGGKIKKKELVQLYSCRPQPLCHLLVCQLPEQDLKLLRNLHA